jgi:hypothetical protein
MREHAAMNFHIRIPARRAAVVAAALLAIAGFAGAVDAAAPAASAARAEPKSVALHARVVQLIGEAECDGQSECHAVGIGAKPCGGAETWLPWSTKVTDARALQDAVQALMQASVEENKASGLASDCMRRPDPTVVCRPRASDGKKTCQLGQGGIASPV